MPRFVVSIFSVGIFTLGTDLASGQNYPNKPIRIVTTIAGTADSTGRLIAQGLASSMGQPVVVDNRGGTAVILAQLVVKAPPDGYTLLIIGNPFWIGPLLEKTPYDPVRDFAPIMAAVNSPNVVVVNPTLSVKSVSELIALAKAKPGELNYAGGGTGSSAHLAAELFKAMAGVNIVRIPYKSGGPAIIDLIGGQVQLMFPNAGLVTAHIKSGRLRALAVTSAQPSALAPGLPTVAASGLPDYESTSLFGVFAPAGTPATLINRLNQEILRVLSRADVKETLLKAGTEVVGSSPMQLGVTIKSEIARLGKVIKDAGIRNE